MSQEHFSFGRVYSFVLLNIAGGLLQLWVVALMLFVKGSGVTVAQLLGDGGLFFFATSLAYSSVFSLTNKYPMTTGTRDFNITLTLVGCVTLLALIVYVSVLSSTPQSGSPPLSGTVFHQIACVTAALVYAFYVSVRTGLFKEIV